VQGGGDISALLASIAAAKAASGTGARSGSPALPGPVNGGSVTGGSVASGGSSTPPHSDGKAVQDEPMI
jgi:hypothetical protein